MTYCSREDVTDRLSAAGVLYAADDDADGEVSEAELQASLDQAISSASAEIDAALSPYVSAPPTENDWLRHRAVDLAAEHLAGRKGAAVPTSLQQAAARSRQWLDQVRGGVFRVPGLAYPSSPSGDRSGLPIVVNPTGGGQ